MDIHQHVESCEFCHALNEKSRAIARANNGKSSPETGTIADQIVLHYLKAKKLNA